VHAQVVTPVAWVIISDHSIGVKSSSGHNDLSAKMGNHAKLA
jgi:hypothetical protein